MTTTVANIKHCVLKPRSEEQREMCEGMRMGRERQLRLRSDESEGEGEREIQASVLFLQVSLACMISSARP